jgi:hypothetical protein
MTFLIRPGAPLYQAQLQARELAHAHSDLAEAA